MNRYLLIIQSDCKDPAREEEFNKWYSEVHVPDMLEAPGMVSATRWQNVHPEGNQKRKYIAVYEIETDDIKKFDATLKEIGKRSATRGRFSDLIVLEPPDVPRVVYQQIMPTKKSVTKNYENQPK